METTTSIYPQFFRLGARCLKRTSDTTTIEIFIPAPAKALPLTHSPSTYPSKERLDQEVATMEPSNQDTYESYVIEFAKAAEKNREYINELRQLRFERQQRELKQQSATA